MFLIRDDDLSFWTDIDEFMKLYKPLLDENFKLCLAVIPYSCRSFYPGDRERFYQEYDYHYIYENTKLVQTIMPYIQNGQIEIMLHGYDHSYHIQVNKQILPLTKELRSKIGNQNIGLVAECIHKDKFVFRKQLIKGKKILEETFNTKVKTFVPPSNSIDRDTVKILDELSLNLSGTITIKFNRPLQFVSIKNYIYKYLWQIFYRYKYPYILKYKNHLELIAYALTPLTDFEFYSRQYNFCKDNEAPFTIATHYWELIENEKLRDDFYEFIKTEKIYSDNKTTLTKLFTGGLHNDINSDSHI